MTDDANDGGADSWTSGGAAALAMYAPEVLTAYGLLVSVRPFGVHDELLESPEVAAFAEQFGVDAAGIDDQVRDRFVQATGDHAAAVVDMVWIADVAPRIRGALDALFGPSDEWPGRRRYPVADTQVAIGGFRESVALLDRLDPDLDRRGTGGAGADRRDAAKSAFSADRDPGVDRRGRPRAAHPGAGRRGRARRRQQLGGQDRRRLALIEHMFDHGVWRGSGAASRRASCTPTSTRSSPPSSSATTRGCAGGR